jgi:predicted nuclease of predicted toxin-antitoxin system
MKFLIDNQLPFALAKSLQEAGYDTRHVLDLALDEAPDSEIVRYHQRTALLL